MGIEENENHNEKKKTFLSLIQGKQSVFECQKEYLFLLGKVCLDDRIALRFSRGTL